MNDCTIGQEAEGDGCVLHAGPMGASCAEAFRDVAESSLCPSERPFVNGAVAERRREFHTVRHCARQALRKLGLPAAPILPDANGLPQWPAGVVGSLTHCPGYRAALVARSADFLSLGLDAEPHAAVPADALDLILRDEERAHVAQLALARSDLHWDRILFCAKEAVYKAWFPLTRRWLDFADVSVSAHPHGSFQARLHVRHTSATGIDLLRFGGRWSVGRGLIVAATWVSRRRPLLAGGA